MLREQWSGSLESSLRMKLLGVSRLTLVSWLKAYSHVAAPRILPVVPYYVPRQLLLVVNIGFLEAFTNVRSDMRDSEARRIGMASTLFCRPQIPENSGFLKAPSAVEEFDIVLL